MHNIHDAKEDSTALIIIIIYICICIKPLQMLLFSAYFVKFFNYNV